MKKREIRRGIGNFLSITRNRLAGKTYVPHPRRAIFIETSGRCNLACRFCAYDKVTPGDYMANETFADYLNQAADLGFSTIYLTPMLGEVFSDQEIDNKFAQLENHSEIDSIGFYSNFILARPEQISALTKLSKLDALFLSIYGYDEESFELTTRKPASQFLKLQDNLETLFEVCKAWQPRNGIHFNIRSKLSDRSILETKGRMGDILRKFVAQYGAQVSTDNEYDSWGGTIDQSEVDSLGIEITDGNHIYMHGACTKVFAEVQIKADGKVHACACRDVDGSLIIGDLKDSTLASILSFQNGPYRKIIESQMKGHFNDNCRSCSSYRSVYDGRPSHYDSSLTTLSYQEAIKLLNNSA